MYAQWPKTKDKIIINYHDNKKNRSEITSTITFPSGSSTNLPSEIKVKESGNGSYVWTIAKGTDKQKNLSNGETRETEFFMEHADKKEEIQMVIAI